MEDNKKMKMAEHDIRWQQKLENFKQSLLKLKGDIHIVAEQQLTKEEEDDYKLYVPATDLHDERVRIIIEKKEYLELAKTGLIKHFEITCKLAWNVMIEYFKYQGNNAIKGSRNAIEEAFNKKLIENKSLCNRCAKN